MRADFRNGAEGTEANGYVRDIDARYRDLVERLPAVVYVGSFEVTGLHYISPRAEEMLGYSPEEWFSDPDLWLKVLHPDDRERVLAEGMSINEEGKPFRAEYRLISKGGREVYVHDEAVPVLDEEGRRGGLWRGIMLDITERKEAEKALRRSEELFRLTFERAGVGMAHLSPDGRWLRINDALCEIFGYTREEMLGLTYLDLTPAEDRDVGAERVRCLLEGEIGPYTVERRYIRKDGSRVWVNLSVSLVRKASGSPDFLVFVAEDITDRKLRELVPDTLTEREIEVLQLIARWQTNQEIARHLAYSSSTIKARVQSILNKLGVESRREAVAKAIRIGLIAPPR